MALIFEIQDETLQVIEAKSKREGRFIVDAHFTLDFNSEEKDSSEFIKNLKRLIKEHKIKDNKVHVVFNNRLTLSKEFIVPRIERRKMNLIVKNEMQMALNLTDDYVYDYMTLSNEEVDGNISERVLAFAIKLQHVKETEKWFKKLNLKIQSIQTSTSTLINMLDFTDIVDNNRPVIITDMQRNYTRFYLYYKQEVFMIRTIHPDTRELDDSGSRFVNLSKLLINSIYNEHDLVVDKIILLGNYNMILDVKENHKSKLDINCELADLNLAFIKNDTDLYSSFSSIGAII